MCVAIVQKPKHQITKKQLKACWENNPDGGGFAFVKNNKVMIHKVLNSFKAFWRAYNKARSENPLSVFLVHCRIMTSGLVNLENCHPFVVKKGLVMIHNGVIDVDLSEKNRSDTYHFTKKLSRIKDDPINNQSYKWLIEESIGSNKLAFLNAKNQFSIINESLGNWINGVWFSNCHWKPAKKYSYVDSYGDLRAYQPYYSTIKNDWVDLCSCGERIDGDESNIYCPDCLSFRKENDIPRIGLG